MPTNGSDVKDIFPRFPSHKLNGFYTCSLILALTDTRQGWRSSPRKISQRPGHVRERFPACKRCPHWKRVAPEAQCTLIHSFSQCREKAQEEFPPSWVFTEWGNDVVLVHALTYWADSENTMWCDVPWYNLDMTSGQSRWRCPTSIPGLFFVPTKRPWELGWAWLHEKIFNEKATNATVFSRSIWPSSLSLMMYHIAHPRRPRGRSWGGQETGAGRKWQRRGRGEKQEGKKELFSCPPLSPHPLPLRHRFPLAPVFLHPMICPWFWRMHVAVIFYINPFTPEFKKCILPTFQKVIVWVM